MKRKANEDFPKAKKVKSIPEAYMIIPSQQQTFHITPPAPSACSVSRNGIKRKANESLSGALTTTKKVRSIPDVYKIISLPTTKLNVYAFGTGDNAELGLGPKPNAKVVKRPRLNRFLLPDTVGVVAVAIGGMHGLALTHEGKVYSWGVNNQFALGRETKVAPRETPAEGSDDHDEDDEPLNALERTPMSVEGFPRDTVITRIAAGDSISVAVTEQG